jgi:acyl-CoA synthetase (AMP-forming)/AMP-acid ligase II
MIYSSPLSTVAIPPLSLGDYVFEHASRWGDRPAIIDASTGDCLTFAEVRLGAQRVAAALGQRGWRKGDVMAMVCPNVPEFALAFHGVGLAGGVVTTASPSASPAELAFQLRDSGARGVLTLPALLPAIRTSAADAHIREWFTFGTADGAIDFARLMGSAAPQCCVTVDPGVDLMALPYSSGTTGRAKGVMLTHRNMVAAMAAITASNSHAGQVHLAVLPFFHIAGMQASMNRPLRDGACCVVMRRFDLAELLHNIERYRVTHLTLVPPIVNALAKSPLVEQYDLSSLRRVNCGAAPLDPALQQAASARIGLQIRQVYGMTETSVGIANNSPALTEADKIKPGASGVLLPNMQARVVEPDSGRNLPAGERGEIWVRGPNIMRGYLNNPQMTDEMIDPDGWMRTGDIGYFDQEGYLFITDRLKELIKVKGRQVAPAMLEGVLLEHPDILDAAVIGVTDEERGEVPRAFVVARPGRSLSAGEVLSFVETRVAPYERLHYVSFIEQIPKSPSGKILRRLLRAEA